MAVITGEFFLHDGMMGKKGEFLFHLGMAPVAKIGHVVTGELLTWSLVEVVAVEAADVVKSVRAGVPERRRAMAADG